MRQDSNVVRNILEDRGLLESSGFLHCPVWVKRVKLDVGMSHTGPNAIEWIRRDPHLLVVGVEPIQSEVDSFWLFAKTLNNFKLIEKQLIILPIALSDKDGFQKINITKGYLGTSSLLIPKRLEVEARVEVPTATLGSLLDCLDLEKFGKIDHLKLDCQGMDLEILRNGGPKIVKIAAITAEAHDGQYRGASNTESELARFLSSYGFKFVNRRSLVRQLVGKLLSKITSIRKLGISFPTTHSVHTPKEFPIEVDDPTFVNMRYEMEIRSGRIRLWQRG